MEFPERTFAPLTSAAEAYDVDGLRSRTPLTTGEGRVLGTRAPGGEGVRGATRPRFGPTLRGGDHGSDARNLTPPPLLESRGGGAGRGSASDHVATQGDKEGG